MTGSIRDRIDLRLCGPSDSEFLGKLLTKYPIIGPWRRRGAGITIDTVVSSVTSVTYITYMITYRSDQSDVGIVFAYGADPVSRTIYVGVAVDTKYINQGLAVEAIVRLLDILILEQGIRIVYFETDPTVIDKQHFLQRVFKIEAVLPRMMMNVDRVNDLVIGAMTSDEWIVLRRRIAVGRNSSG